MTEQPTCGEGLAANAAVPAKMAQFLDSLADTLDSHIEALVPGDDKAALERRAYMSLVQQYRDASSRLAAAAREMAGYKVLPMGAHDEQVLTRADALEPFRNYVQTKRELLDLLTDSYAIDQRMLQEAGSG